MKTLGKGAEAIIYLKDGDVLKDRLVKPYRIPEIDIPLRRSRTRRESKILEKLKAAEFPAPILIQTDRQSLITMGRVVGEKVRDVIEKNDTLPICKQIGGLIRKLHDLGIIHGDLTTSNMILNPSGKVVFIDFGLSFFSEKDEDKAVDLHLMKQALDSSHYRISEKGFNAVLNAYGKKAVIRRLEKVEQRGRNKGKH